MHGKGHCLHVAQWCAFKYNKKVDNGLKESLTAGAEKSHALDHN